MVRKSGSRIPRSDAKNFAKCGNTAYYHRIYCNEENCEFKKFTSSKKVEPKGGKD